MPILFKNKFSLLRSTLVGRWFEKEGEPKKSLKVSSFASDPQKITLWFDRFSKLTNYVTIQEILSCTRQRTILHEPFTHIWPDGYHRLCSSNPSKSLFHFFVTIFCEDADLGPEKRGDIAGGPVAADGWCCCKQLILAYRLSWWLSGLEFMMVRGGMLPLRHVALSAEWWRNKAKCQLEIAIWMFLICQNSSSGDWSQPWTCKLIF